MFLSREHFISNIPDIARTTNGKIQELAYEHTHVGPQRTTLVTRQDSEGIFTVYRSDFVYDEVPVRFFDEVNTAFDGVNTAVESVSNDLVLVGTFRNAKRALVTADRYLQRQYKRSLKQEGR